MIWIYMLIGLVIGAIISTIVIWLRNHKLQQQRVLQQYTLKRSQDDLEKYCIELINYFTKSAELMDNISYDYHQLYQHIAKSSRDLLQEITAKNNSFKNYPNKESKVTNNQTLIPRDYSEETSDFLHDTTKHN